MSSSFARSDWRWHCRDQRFRRWRRSILGHDRPWTVGVGANLEKLVASLKVRDEALWKVHNAGASVHKGRKKMADIEVVVVDDEVDDDVANTPPLRRSKRGRNDL